MGQIFISIHLPHDWNPPSLHRTIGWTPFLPLFTPCIIPWHSHFTHHPSFLHISHRHYHFHSSIPLCIHHHKEVNYIPNTQDTQSTACLYGYSACSSLLDWMPLWTHTHTMFHCHLSMNTPSLITECLFQDRQHWPTPGYHSIIKDTQDYLP